MVEARAGGSRGSGKLEKGGNELSDERATRQQTVSKQVKNC